MVAHGTASSPFNISTGVRQGCPLSPLLFNIYMDFLARQVLQECEAAGVRGFKVAYRLHGQLMDAPTDQVLYTLLLLYADDLVLLAPSGGDLQTALVVLDAVAQRWGMAVNYGKTVGLIVQPPISEQVEEPPAPFAPPPAAATVIHVGPHTVAIHDHFKYLGSITQAHGGQDRELQNRICSAMQAFNALKRSVFASRHVSRASKLAFYHALVLSRLTYGAAESWALTASQLAHLEACHHDCLRRMTGQRRGPDGPSTSHLLQLTRQAPIAHLLRRHRVRWLGHAARRPESTGVHKLLHASSIPGHPRCVGRPCLTWMDAAMHDMHTLGPAVKLDLVHDWPRLALDRGLWRGIVQHC